MLMMISFRILLLFNGQLHDDAHCADCVQVVRIFAAGVDDYMAASGVPSSTTPHIVILIWYLFVLNGILAACISDVTSCVAVTDQRLCEVVEHAGAWPSRARRVEPPAAIKLHNNLTSYYLFPPAGRPPRGGRRHSHSTRINATLPNIEILISSGWGRATPQLKLPKRP
ncbi:hypothetical protein EVAR_56165_1 [Eumeta japonica]|uniref:Secreted protein n=1 Tax=Eumeta variegata TaxID=151549 RepID=A0A4C1Y3M8_EUMVA|nr:hypothetical protein EVAR_56165_1 [Eumeta japonica]